MQILCIFALPNKQKLKTMTTSEITKTIKKLNIQPTYYSIGFRRLIVLPLRVRQNINLACVLKGESNDNSMKEFLNTLTETQYINWLKAA